MTSSKKRLVVALSCGVLAAVLLAVYANDVREQATSSRAQALAHYGGEQVEVLVATRDILAGERLDAHNVSYQLWVADLLPAGAVLDISDVEGMTATVPILKNEPIARARLGEQTRQIVVPEGLCAVSISADEVKAVGGALVPGMKVDIYSIGTKTVTLIAQNALILETSNSYSSSLSSGSSSSSARASLKWVTVAVEAKTVQELLAAARENTLTLVLPGEDVERTAPDTSEANSFEPTGNAIVNTPSTTEGLS